MVDVKYCRGRNGRLRNGWDKAPLPKARVNLLCIKTYWQRDVTLKSKLTESKGGDFYLRKEIETVALLTSRVLAILTSIVYE